MATATMGLRRRVTVNNLPTPTSQQSPASTSASTSANVSNKRSRAENNNSPSHGNLNSLNAGRDEPPIKKSRGTGTGSSAKARANSPAVTESLIERSHGHQTSGKGRNVSGGKLSSRTKSPSISTVTTTNNTNVSSVSSVTSTNVSNGQQVQADISASGFNVLASTGWPTPTSIPDAATYTSMTGLNMTGPGQPSLCATGSLALPPSIPYMATSMATFVGNATNLSKNSAVSYLDISNMTGGSLNSNSSSSLGYPCKSTAVNSGQEANGNNVVPLPFSGVVPANGASVSSAYGAKPSTQPLQTNPVDAAVLSSVKTFQNDSMFNAYQPWVIKTYGDLAKTKTITIKKYARILRTLKGEEVNSAENSKFRFWVKSKGFHIGQPVGYDAKPADRIVGRHAVSSPGLDPPLYVPTQLPHNKALNGAEGTVPPGRVYKKVAIVENFFDIIHAVHVDLEGRPGKHAGQKRTYRTITETYAFLPREAVTRFLLGCTECQRRPRTPSPSNLSNQSQAPSVPSVPVGVAVTGTATSTTVPPPLLPPPPTTSTTTTTTTTTTPLSPTPAATALSAPQPVQSNPNPREASHPPESKSLFSYRHPKHQQRSNSASVGTPKSDKDRDKDKERVDKEREKAEKDKEREEKYNPLSITNLLKKEPASGFTGPTTTTPTTITVNDSLAESRRTPESDRASSRSSASSKRKRMLPEGRTPSPPPTIPLPTPWSPGLDTTNTPIDYSLPITTTYLKHQQRIQAQQNKVAAAAAAAAAAQEEQEREMRERASPIVVMMEAEIERDRFSPAAGLIDTNLNLLATIQHLHCQVMLALTERLRPSVLPASLMLPPATGIFPNILIGNEYSMPMARHHL